MLRLWNGREIDNGPTANGKLDLRLETLLNVIGDTDATSKGTIDPLYEAKARVLSHAVSTSWKRNSLPPFWACMGGAWSLQPNVFQSCERIRSLAGAVALSP